MYAGRQHEELMRGVQTFREARSDSQIDVYVLSAGYGVIHETRSIAPYDVSFSDMSGSEIHEWAQVLDVPEQVGSFLAGSADLIIVLLGRKYATAAGINEEVNLGGPVLFFANQETAHDLPDLARLKPVVVRQRDATRFSEGIVWLKGHLARRLLSKLVHNPGLIDTFTDPGSDVLDLLDDQITMPFNG
jgi:hypothetical protein